MQTVLNILDELGLGPFTIIGIQKGLPMRSQQFALRWAPLSAALAE
jgi:uncharacterized membrane protein YeiH